MAWTAQDNFDSYSDGGLNTLNGGSGNWNSAWTANAGVTVQGTTVYQGAKAVKDLNNSAGASRQITAQTSAKFYFAIRVAQTNKEYYWIGAPGADSIGIRFTSTGNIEYLSSDGGAWNTLIAGYSANVWYIFEISWTDASTTNVRYRVGTTSYTADTGTKGTLAGRSNNIINSHFSAGSANVEAYFDDITINDPLEAVGPANLKTYNTNAKANIKTINTNPIANVKSLDTNV